MPVGDANAALLFRVASSLTETAAVLLASQGYETALAAGTKAFEDVQPLPGDDALHTMGDTGSEIVRRSVATPTPTSVNWTQTDALIGTQRGLVTDRALLHPGTSHVVAVRPDTTLVALALTDGSETASQFYSGQFESLAIASDGTIYAWMTEGLPTGSNLQRYTFDGVNFTAVAAPGETGLLRASGVFKGMFLNAAETRIYILDFVSGGSPEWQLRGYSTTDFSLESTITITPPDSNYQVRARANSHAQVLRRLALGLSA